MIRSILYLLLAFGLTCSCSKVKKEEEKISSFNILDYIKLDSYKREGVYTLYTGYDFNEPGHFLLDQKGSQTDSLFLKIDKYNRKSNFTYVYNHFKSIDSLICYKDSICKVNSDILKLLGRKEILIGNSKLLVSKFLYDPKDKLYMSNLFVNDSMGILFNQVSGQGRTLLQYKFNTDYEKLQEKIFLDTTFYKFQMQ